MFGEWIRRAVYWSVDFLSGSKVRMQFRDIQRTMEHATDQETIMYQKAFLERILNYAQERVEYYKNIPNGSSLDAFPVVNKNIIKENRGNFCPENMLREKKHCRAAYQRFDGHAFRGPAGHQKERQSSR